MRLETCVRGELEINLLFAPILMSHLHMTMKFVYVSVGRSFTRAIL